MLAQNLKIGDVIYVVDNCIMSIGEIIRSTILVDNSIKFVIVWRVKAHSFLPESNEAWFRRDPTEPITRYIGKMLLTNDEDLAVEELKKQQLLLSKPS